MLKKYFFYLFRWQLSTPILAGVLWVLKDYSNISATIIANFIGGLIFFWVDSFIFKTKIINSLWEIKNNIICYDCGRICKGYRLVKTKNYDRLNDSNPEFRCANCSKVKSAELKKRGVSV